MKQFRPLQAFSERIAVYPVVVNKRLKFFKGSLTEMCKTP